MGFAMLGFILFGTAAIFIASFQVTAVLSLISFILNGFMNGILNALLILLIPEDKRGMLLGTVMTASMLGNGASSLMYGILGDLIPLRTLGTISFLLGLIPAAMVFSRDVQSIDIKKDKE